MQLGVDSGLAGYSAGIGSFSACSFTIVIEVGISIINPQEIFLTL